MEAVAQGWTQAKEMVVQSEIADFEDEMLTARKKILVEKDPTIRLFENALGDFKFDQNGLTSELEAKRILRFLGAQEPLESIFLGDHYQVWGKLPTDNEIRIWTKTYEADGTNCYGVRFQTSKLRNYIIVNDTYIRICKP